MFTLTNDHACGSPLRATEHAGTDVQLRDLVFRHSGQLERLLLEEMRHTGPACAQAFGGCVEANRSRGQAIFASWLYGVTLRLLRDALATDSAGRFVTRFLQVFPREFARPMVILALSADSYVDCAMYLCKPATAPARDIALPADSGGWVRQHLS